MVGKISASLIVHLQEQKNSPNRVEMHGGAAGGHGHGQGGRGGGEGYIC